MPMLRHVNKDHIVPELQLVERFHRLMIAAEAEAWTVSAVSPPALAWAMVFVGSPRAIP